MLSGFRHFATLAEADRYHVNTNFDWSRWNAMLQKERSGIHTYTSNAYSLINTPLRHGTTPDAQVQKWINDATSGMNKWQAAEDVVTFRGAGLHWTANLLGGTENQMSNAAFLKSRIGKTFTDKGFMSSAVHESKAWGGEVMYKIYVNKGTSGMYVDRISAYQGESEFLFNRDTQFKVHQIKTNDMGRIVELVLEALPVKKKK